mmetsp:Transcript_51999/g.118672  ORF Transcript_51999/g.118672 Transcript_51999/m.118672 type:complete len:845 (+) Transcript_51999:33-2567(+)
MGVPGLHRWVERHVPASREEGEAKKKQTFDNVYLDFNGVVHGALGQAPPGDEEALFQVVEVSIDAILEVAVPTKLVLLALDGVAPRAKLNQQRSRRFKAGLAAQQAVEEAEKKAQAAAARAEAVAARAEGAEAGKAEGAGARAEEPEPGKVEEAEAEKAGEAVVERAEEAEAEKAEEAEAEKAEEDAEDQATPAEVAPEQQAATGTGVYMDKNAITPGTGFMKRLTERLEAWAEKSAAKWPGVTLVISGDREPGEGEQKILTVMRAHPERSHCVCSGDADLVFLGLAAHVADASVLRDRPRKVRGQFVEGPPTYEYVRVAPIRDFLCSKFPEHEPKRIVEDFVALCCLAGNDFLPHTQALNIREGGIDYLLEAYGKVLPQVGHLVDEQGLILDRWVVVLDELLEVEVESALTALGLGLGYPSRYQGPDPPSDLWDGLTVHIRKAPPRTGHKDVVTCMQRCGPVTATFANGKASWLVRFETPEAAVKALTSHRRISGMKLFVEWFNPEVIQVRDPTKFPEVEEKADWRPAVRAEVADSFQFWLGPRNLAQDGFLRRHSRSSPDRFVPLTVFKSFGKLKTLCQDTAELEEILKTTPGVELRGTGETAAVRGVEDHSVREGEQDQVPLQREALELVQKGEYARALQVLQGMMTTQGPTTAEAPPISDAAATAAFRAHSYMQGVEWTLSYYLHDGCPSWSWFYPAHFPPLLFALREACAAAAPRLAKPAADQPLVPEMQLLSVLPPQSAALLPAPLQELVLAGESAVAEYFPGSFEVAWLSPNDPEWAAVPLLPFVEVGRLEAAAVAAGWEPPQDPWRPARAARCVGEALRVWDFTSPELVAPPEASL